MILGIIQARMGSSRLPGKTLIDIAGKPMLAHVVDRLRAARNVDEVIVATSRSSSDDPIADFCEANNILCFRGSENHVLDRFCRTAKPYQPEAVVRVTADCPLLDPEVVDDVVDSWNVDRDDYVSNTLHFTYPNGLEVEVIAYPALETARHEASTPSEREHVTSYITRSGKFSTLNVSSNRDLGGKHFRWIVEQEEDLELVRRIYGHFAPRTDFTWHEVLSLYEQRPELHDINGHIPRNENDLRIRLEKAVAGTVPKLKLLRSLEWYERSKRVIPSPSKVLSRGGVQTVFGATPLFLERGDGYWVWDVDGNEYIDYIQGLSPNILGYAHSEVNAYVSTVLSRGHSFSLPHPLEVQLAEKMVEIVPCADMVRFGKNGSDATSGAIRAARAYTERDHVATCGYRGWQDWNVSAAVQNIGVPQTLQNLTHKFNYNDIQDLEKLFHQHENEFAAVIMEPVNFTPPDEGYLEAVKELTHKHGALLIFDEICSGWHFGLGGAQKRFGVKPDLSTFGKAMGNGFPISAVVGRSDVMQVFEEISYSIAFGAEVASIAASLKVIDILEHTSALTVIEENGRMIQEGFNYIAHELGILERFNCVGYPWWSVIHMKNADGDESMLERRLFLQEIIKRGILSNGFHNVTAAHDATAVEMTLDAYGGALKTIAMFLEDKNPARFLESDGA